MADLKKDFTRGQENAQDGLNNNFTEIQKTLDFVDENATQLAKAQKFVTESKNADWDSREVRYRRQGDMVTAFIAVKPSASSDGAWKGISQFPKGYKPTSLAEVAGVLIQNSIKGFMGTLYANAYGLSAILEDGSKKYTYICSVTYSTSDPFPESDKVMTFTTP